MKSTKPMTAGHSSSGPHIVLVRGNFTVPLGHHAVCAPANRSSLNSQMRRWREQHSRPDASRTKPLIICLQELHYAIWPMVCVRRRR